jgi:23S rRNA (cytosine1962-C5)-methyltransferase
VSGKPHKTPSLRLPDRLENTLLLGHPWIFQEQVPRGFDAPVGSWVQIRCGKFEGYALWDPDSALALRVYSRGEYPSAEWLTERVREAWDLRKSVRAFDTTAFRWLHGEADGLPGLVVDYYDGYAVIVCDSPAAERLVPALANSLRAVEPQLHGVMLRRRNRAEPGEDGPLEKRQLIAGNLPPEDLTVREHGLLFRANLFVGQKTGLFLDQRENRQRLAQRCAGLNVLNLFSYSGGFSVHAACAGATSVVSVDIAKGAGVDAAENFRLNGLDPDRHEFVAADVFQFLEQARLKKRRFDLVICDPPSFARNHAQLQKALAAYTRVNAAGMKVTEPGGLYAASSCTARVTPSDFIESLALSARKAQSRYQVIEENGHAADHPVLVSHPEGRYLKFVLGRLSPRV